MKYYFWILGIFFFESCTHIYRPTLIGVVCDVETKVPITGATIVFIQDTLTLGSTFGSMNANVGEHYSTNNSGIFKIERIKDKNMRLSPYTSNYSTIVTISHKDYNIDTISFREVPISLPKYTLDTIWLTKRKIK